MHFEATSTTWWLTGDFSSPLSNQTLEKLKLQVHEDVYILCLLHDTSQMHIEGNQ